MTRESWDLIGGICYAGNSNGRPLFPRRNPVAKHMHEFNRAKRLTNRRVYQRHPKHKSVDNLN